MARLSATPALLLLVALGGAAAGFGLGMSFGGPAPALAGERSDSFTGRRADGDAGDRSAEDASLVRPEEGPVERGGSTRVVDAPSVSRTTIDRAVSRTAAPAVELPSGEGVIRGVARDRDGKPIPGVEVVLTPPQDRQPARKSSESMGADDRTLTLEETLERAAQKWARKEGAARRSTSGDDGTFALEGLPDRPFRVRGEAEGWRFRVDGPSLVSPGAEVVLVGRPTSVFELRLTRSSGPAVTEAYVNVGSSWLEWSAEDPFVHVTSRNLNVSVLAEPFAAHEVGERLYGRWVSPSVPVSVAPDGSTVVEIELEPNCVLAGRVEGPRYGSSSVFALPLREGERFDPSMKINGGSSAGGSSGLYAISGLLPGRYAVGIKDDQDDTAVHHEIVELVDGLNRVDLVKGDVDMSRCVSVLSLAPDGSRLESVSYGFEWTRGDDDRDTEGVRVFRDIEGRDLVDLDNFYSFDIDDWPAGTRMWIYASCSGYGRATAPYEPGQREAVLRFEAPCELKVQIEGDFRAGGYTVAVYDASKGEEDRPRLKSARQGRSGARISRAGVAHFRGLAPGPVEVRLERSVRWWGRGLEVDSAELTLSGADHQVTLTAAALADLSVVVTPIEKDRDLSLVVPDPTDDDGERYVGWTQCNESGRAEFKGLPAGSYVLVDQKSGARLEVTAPSAEITWDLSDYRMELTVSVYTRDGKLSEWGFQGGDVILAMDGDPIAEEEDILDRLADEGVTLTVRRGEETLEIKVPRYPRSERRASKLGGDFYIDS